MTDSFAAFLLGIVDQALAKEQINKLGLGCMMGGNFQRDFLVHPNTTDGHLRVGGERQGRVKVPSVCLGKRYSLREKCKRNRGSMD